MTNEPHQPCPYVSCGSSDAFSYNTGGYGRCHSCERSYPSREPTFEWVAEKYPTKNNISGNRNYKEEEFLSIMEEPKVTTEGKYTSCRGITESTMKHYGVLTYGDRQEYPYPSGGLKVRKMPKDFFAKNGFKGDELFGMNLFSDGSS